MWPGTLRASRPCSASGTSRRSASRDRPGLPDVAGQTSESRPGAGPAREQRCAGWRSPLGVVEGSKLFMLSLSLESSVLVCRVVTSLQMG